MPWVKLLKSKYLGGKSFLHDDLSFNSCSWLWADLKNTVDLITKGACFNVHVNSDILIWKDHWMSSISGFKAIRPPSHHNPSTLNLVKDLINVRSLTWNSELLSANVFPVEVTKIKKIEISPRILPKIIFWCTSKSDAFSSKSAY